MAEKKALLCWPDWMPKPQQPDYTYTPVDRRTKTDMEVGSILRVNFDTDETTLDCVLILNAVQAQWFEQFERNLLHQGAQWFRMPIQIAGCIEWHTVRFASRPKAGSLIGVTHTTYTLRLDVDKRNLKLCPDVIELLVCISPQDILSASANTGAFWMSLAALQPPKHVYNALCPWLDGVLWCVPDEEFCGTALTLREAMQEIIPSIDLPDIKTDKQDSI